MPQEAGNIPAVDAKAATIEDDTARLATIMWKRLIPIGGRQSMHSFLGDQLLARTSDF